MQGHLYSIDEPEWGIGAVLSQLDAKEQDWSIPITPWSYSIVREDIQS